MKKPHEGGSVSQTTTSSTTTTQNPRFSDTTHYI